MRSWSSYPTNPTHDLKTSFQHPVAIVAQDPVACLETGLDLTARIHPKSLAFPLPPLYKTKQWVPLGVHVGSSHKCFLAASSNQTWLCATFTRKRCPLWCSPAPFCRPLCAIFLHRFALFLHPTAFRATALGSFRAEADARLQS